MKSKPPRTYIRSIGQHHISIAELPFKRNQDVAEVKQYTSPLLYGLHVVDGWHNPEYISGEIAGRNAARFTIRRFPELFLQSKDLNLKKRAVGVANQLEKEFLYRFPKHIASVGAFLFQFEKETCIVSEGSIYVWIWGGTCWITPAEIGNYFLPYPKYPTDVSRFFGRGELKSNPLYSCEPDTILLKNDTPVFIATDGIVPALSPEKLTALTKKQPDNQLFPSVLHCLESSKQHDDITIALRLTKKG